MALAKPVGTMDLHTFGGLDSTCSYHGKLWINVNGGDNKRNADLEDFSIKLDCTLRACVWKQEFTRVWNVDINHSPCRNMLKVQVESDTAGGNKVFGKQGAVTDTRMQEGT